MIDDFNLIENMQLIKMSNKHGSSSLQLTFKILLWS